jgi:hypothetical protein
VLDTRRVSIRYSYLDRTHSLRRKGRYYRHSDCDFRPTCPSTDRHGGRRGKCPTVVRLHGFLQLLGRTESDFLAGLDLDRLPGL